MLRTALTFTCAIGTALTVACGGSNQSAERNDNPAAQPAGAAARGEAPVPLEVRGCLTASGDQFALTALRTASGSTTGNNNAGAGSNGGAPAANQTPTTETYQLTRGTQAQDDMRNYVGREVRVVGDADPPRIAEVQESTPSAPAVGTSGQQGAQQNRTPAAGGAQVKSVTETRLQVRTLRVASITPTGNDCAEGTNLTATPANTAQ